VLTAALALVALPGVVGSTPPRPEPTISADAFQALRLDVPRGGSAIQVEPPDPALRADGFLEAEDLLIEPVLQSDVVAFVAPVRPKVSPPSSKLGVSFKPARYTLTGTATFYDNGTTAMRLPRGTVIRVCGDGGCIERVVNDYGPSKAGGRLIDLYRPDFFEICGCSWWEGVTNVTVYVY
jgi:hypothetical protein